MHNLTVNEERMGEARLRDILQNNWPVFFKNVKVKKKKERPGNQSKSKDTEELWQVSTTCDPGQGSGPKTKTATKDIIGTTGEIQIWT